MEKTLRKCAIYGFVLGMAISILIVNYKETINAVTVYKPTFDYVISILRYSIIGMFLGLFVGWQINERKKDKQEKTTYYVEFFFAVLLIVVVFQLIFGW